MAEIHGAASPSCVIEGILLLWPLPSFRFLFMLFLSLGFRVLTVVLGHLLFVVAFHGCLVSASHSMARLVQRAHGDNKELTELTFGLSTLWIAF